MWFGRLWCGVCVLVVWGLVSGVMVCGGWLVLVVVCVGLVSFCCMRIGCWLCCWF